MEKPRYSVWIRWSNEDAAFLAEVPELPGCMADGATPSEALLAGDIAAEVWIETAVELGRPIPTF